MCTGLDRIRFCDFPESCGEGQIGVNILDFVFEGRVRMFGNKIFLLAMIVAATIMGSARGELIVGDIQIIGYRSTADDALSFVTWANISAGSSLHFTDSGFFSDGTYRSSEDVMSWTASTAISAGSVIRITSSDSAANGTSNTGSVTGRLNGLSTSGDQIFVGRGAAFVSNSDTTVPGTTYTGTLLYGFDFNGSNTTWDTTATTTSTSALPSSLNVPFGNMAVTHVDNGQYTGARTGLTVDQFKAAIANSSNWTFSNDGTAFGVLNTGGFTAVPEPTSMALVGLVGVVGVVVRARRRLTRKA